MVQSKWTIWNTVGMIAALVLLFYWLSRPSSPPNVVVAPTLADIAKKAAEDKQELAFQKTALFANAIKSGLRDPDSVVWEGVRANDDASVICIEYRAKNGFGGMNKELQYMQIARHLKIQRIGIGIASRSSRT